MENRVWTLGGDMLEEGGGHSTKCHMVCLQHYVRYHPSPFVPSILTLFIALYH